MATDAEVALLRKLVGDAAYTDTQLAEALDALPCPVPTDLDGYPQVGAPVIADTYGVAARLWDDRALELETSGDAVPEDVRVTSERSGDVSRSYAGAGKLVSDAQLTPQRMRAIARRLRKRSCNNAAARTIIVATASGRRELPVRGGLYPSQIVN